MQHSDCLKGIGDGVIDSAFVVIKSHRLTSPLKADDTRRSRPMLGHDDLGKSGSVFGIVSVGAMQKHDDVGILLDGAAFTKVGQSRSLIVSQFHSTIEL